MKDSKQIKTFDEAWFYEDFPEGVPRGGMNLTPEEYYKDAQREKLLLKYVELGYVKGVQEMLGMGVNPNIQNLYGMTPLMIASMCGHESIIRVLLESRDINLEVTNGFGLNALMIATYYGQPNIVKTLLESGFHLNTKDHYDRNLLDIALKGLKLHYNPSNPNKEKLKKSYAEVIKLLRDMGVEGTNVGQEHKPVHVMVPDDVKLLDILNSPQKVFVIEDERHVLIRSLGNNFAEVQESPFKSTASSSSSAQLKSSGSKQKISSSTTTEFKGEKDNTNSENSSNVKTDNAAQGNSSLNKILQSDYIKIVDEAEHQYIIPDLTLSSYIKAIQKNDTKVNEAKMAAENSTNYVVRLKQYYIDEVELPHEIGQVIKASDDVIMSFGGDSFNYDNHGEAIFNIPAIPVM